MAQRRLNNDYRDQEKWQKMAVINTAMSGIFSSDRTIREYNDNIWHLKPISQKPEKAEKAEKAETKAEAKPEPKKKSKK